MLEYTFRVDPRNPGQYFACCGLLELCALLDPGSDAFFAAEGTLFRLRCADCLRVSLALEPPAAEPPLGPALEPLVMSVGGRRLSLNWWLNETWTEKSPLKTWGGQQTPRKMLTDLMQLLGPQAFPSELFSHAAYTTTRFGVDPRSAWSALDAGYSPNDDNQPTATYPWVEVLAVVGLQGFRPAQIGHNRFRYSLWLAPLPLPSARAACASPWKGLPHRSFAFPVLVRGQGYKTFQFAQGVNHV